MKKLIVAALLASTLSGCYSMTYSAEQFPEDGISMSSEKKAHVVRSFRAEEKGIWIIGGLLPISSPSFDGAIRRESRGKPVRAVRIHSEESFTDGLIYVGSSVLASLVVAGLNPTGNPATSTMLGLITGLLVPHLRTVTIEGDVVEPASP